jgi:tetratricopeptide (TPR) repeat protein
MRILRIALLLTAIAVVRSTAVQAQDHHHPAGDVERLGRVEFPVSCADAAASGFATGVAMLHSFWFEAAEDQFSHIIEAHPACAMAHWGRAVMFMTNPMTRAAPSPAAMRDGLAAARRAAELAEAATPRERMYIDAALAFFDQPEGTTHAARMAAFETSLEALYRAYPDDNEAAIFYARTLVANAAPDDHTFARQLKAAEIMEPLFAAHPDHPGVAHYLIHAYDAPPLAEHGTQAALAYASIAPDAPHALHMPSHIFTRLGYWDESIETNARSARAEPDSNAAVHPMDYKVYAYLQQGRDGEAKRVLDRAVDNPDRYYGGILGYNFAAMPARFALERDAWSEATTLRVPVGALPYVEAVTRFARAVGAARAGDAAAASAEVDALGTLKRALDEAGDAEWATRVEAQRLAAASWTAYAAGDTDEALRLGLAAAGVEETIEKHPVTPGPLLPARELYGDLLADLGRHDEALAEYEKTLVREPRRARTLHGAARAAERAGNTAAAARHYSELLEVMQKADPGRPEIAAARRFLQRTGEPSDRR